MGNQGVISLIFLLCGTLGVPRVSCCDIDGPGNCAFHKFNNQTISITNTLCSWTSDGFETYQFKNDTFFDGYVRLEYNRKEGTLTSRKSCSTQGQTHCLAFWYSFDVDKTIDLSLSIVQHELESSTNKLLSWSSSRVSVWNYAEVSVKSLSVFNIVFTAKRRFKGYSTNSVYLDKIAYRKSPCTLRPNNESAKTINEIMTTPTTPPTNPRVAGTTKTSTVVAVTLQSNQSPSITFVPGTDTPDDRERSMNSPSQSNNISVIVGAVVGVLVVVIVAAALLLLFKRKQLGFCKTYSRRTQQKDDWPMNASDNVAYSLEAGDPQTVNSAHVNHAQHNTNNGNQDTARSLNPSHDGNIIAHLEGLSSKNAAAAVYAKVNKPMGTKQKKLTHSTAKTDDEDIYEIREDSTCNVEGHGSGREYHVSAEEPIRTQQGRQDGVYHILEEDPELNDSRVYTAQNEEATRIQGETGEYNSLDFDGKSYLPVKSEAATKAVYSHVTEGGEDTYSHVDRDKKVKVIDNEYSHIK